MGEKIKLARRLRRSALKNASNFPNLKLFFRCYFAFLLDCILLGRSSFVLTFRRKCSASLGKQFSDWGLYFYETFYKFFLIHILRPATTEMSDYELNLICKELSPPTYTYTTNLLDEVSLGNFLKECGFTISGKYLLSYQSLYKISKI